MFNHTRKLTALHLVALVLGGGRVAHDCRPGRRSLDTDFLAIFFTSTSQASLQYLESMSM